MKTLLFSLALWIGQNSEFQLVQGTALPDVHSADPQTLAVRLFEGEIPSSLSTSDLRAIAEQIEALYSHEEHTIYVSRTLDPDSLHGRGVLVHELVHYLQYAQGAHLAVPCVNRLEADAYRIQAAYLRAHGSEPEFDDFTVGARSLCSR